MATREEARGSFLADRQPHPGAVSIAETKVDTTCFPFAR